MQPQSAVFVGRNMHHRTIAYCVTRLHWCPKPQLVGSYVQTKPAPSGKYSQLQQFRANKQLLFPETQPRKDKAHNQHWPILASWALSNRCSILPSCWAQSVCSKRTLGPLWGPSGRLIKQAPALVAMSSCTQLSELLWSSASHSTHDRACQSTL